MLYRHNPVIVIHSLLRMLPALLLCVLSTHIRAVVQSMPDLRPHLVPQLTLPTTFAALSPDGRFVFTGYGSVGQLWDTATGLIVRHFPVDIGNSVTFSADGKSLLTGRGKLLDITSGEVIRQFPESELAAFSPDGQFIIATGGENPNDMILYEAATLHKVQQFTGHTELITSFAVSRDGRYILTGSNDKTARLWNIVTGAEMRRFGGHTSAVMSVALSRDGRYVLTGSTDNTVRVWNLLTGIEVQRLTFTDQHYRESLAFTADSKSLIFEGDDCSVTLASIATGKTVRRCIGHTNWIASISVSQDGRYLLTSSYDETARLWDARTGAEIQCFTGHTTGVQSAHFSPDGRYIIITDDDGTGSTDQWKVGIAQPVYRSAGAKYSTDARSALSKYNSKVVRMSDAASGKEIHRFSLHEKNISLFTFSPDGRQVLLGTEDGSAQLYDAITGAEVKSINALTSAVTTAFFSPDGRYILLGGKKDAVARLWDTATNTFIQEFPSQIFLMIAAFSPDSRHLLIGERDGSASLWETATGAKVHRFLKSRPKDRVSSLSFSPNRRYIIDLTGNYFSLGRRSFPPDQEPFLVCYSVFSPPNRRPRW